LSQGTFKTNNLILNDSKANIPSKG